MKTYGKAIEMPVQGKDTVISLPDLEDKIIDGKIECGEYTLSKSECGVVATIIGFWCNGITMKDAMKEKK